MNLQKLGRLAVCLLLVGCLILNASPVRAQAASTDLEDQLSPLPVELVAGSLLIGLGVLPGEDVSVWDSLVDGCIGFLESSDFVEDGLFYMIVRYSDAYYFPWVLVSEAFFSLVELGIIYLDVSGTVSVHPDFTAGTFPLNPSTEYDVYPVWYSSVVELPVSNLTLEFLPLGIAADYESTRTLTQEYVWSGGVASSPVLSLSDVLSSDMLNNTFDEIIGLLPVALFVLVGYLGLRKGIAFIRDVLYEA